MNKQPVFLTDRDRLVILEAIAGMPNAAVPDLSLIHISYLSAARHHQNGEKIVDALRRAGRII